MSLLIYYGTPENNIDITKKVYEQFTADDHIIIPPNDDLRARFFTDPCFRTIKKIFISGLSSLQTFDSKTTILIHTKTNYIIDDLALARKILAKTKLNHELKVLALHTLLKIEGGTMLDEFPEQCMVAEFFTGKEKVLEIGGNIGRNSLIISSIVENLVVLECSDVTNIQKNRSLNNMKFHIENAALSAKKLFQKGWHTSQTQLEGYNEVPIISYSELQEKYKIDFDTLVLDCEGAFYFILNDFPEILDRIKTIIVENDYRDVNHKNFVDNKLIERNFSRIFVKEGPEEAKILGLPCLSNFYEVWRILETEIVKTEIVNKKVDKYPHVLFFRYDKYSDIDSTMEKMDCSIQIINSKNDLSNLYDSNFPILVTYGDEKEYYDDVYKVLTHHINIRWIHHTNIDANFVNGVNFCYIHNILLDRSFTRPLFSIFTTCYNSYEKINRAYNSILTQTNINWEWVIVDDSPDDLHFEFLKKKFIHDKKVRLYKRSCNSGNIGNVKNEAVSLCRGKYVLEMDHDDEILPDLIHDSVKAFEDPEVGFVYMDFINIYENGNNFSYSDFISLGYGAYYMQKYQNKWRYVYITPNINNITLSSITALPNHPRIWRTETLLKLGNYSEFLPICDDQEILMRTALNTKMVKIPKLSYVQYMNENNNNFSLIRNSEINRLGPQFIVPQFYKVYNVHEKMKEMNAYEDEKYIKNPVPFWKRDDEHKYCNKRVLYDYDTQYCIIGYIAFMENYDRIKEAYENPRNDFLFLESTIDKQSLCNFLDEMNFTRMKCYSIEATNEQLRKYFDLYKTCENTILID